MLIPNVFISGGFVVRTGKTDDGKIQSVKLRTPFTAIHKWSFTPPSKQNSPNHSSDDYYYSKSSSSSQNLAIGSTSKLSINKPDLGGHRASV